MKKILLGLLAVLALLVGSTAVSATWGCGPKCQNFTACCDATLTGMDGSFQEGEPIDGAITVSYTGGPGCSPTYCTDWWDEWMKYNVTNSSGDSVYTGSVPDFTLLSLPHDIPISIAGGLPEGDYEVELYGVTGKTVLFWVKCKSFFQVVTGGFSVVPELTAVGALAAVAVIGFAYMRKQKG